MTDYLASIHRHCGHLAHGVRHVVLVLLKLRDAEIELIDLRHMRFFQAEHILLPLPLERRHLRRMLRLTSRATAGVGELVQESGAVEKANDLRSVLASVQQKKVGEAMRKEHETQVLKHCK